MGLNISKNGIIAVSNLIEASIYNKQASIGQQINPNILNNTIEIYTNSSGTISSNKTYVAVPSSYIQAHAGQVLVFSYDVCALGDRSSTEQGQTAYNYTRYGIHGAMTGVNGSGSSTTQYPFADYLNYSGNAARVIQSWIIPTGWQQYGDLGFSVQNYDKPSSTNTATWFIKNVKLELSTFATPFTKYEQILADGNYLHAQEFIEI